MTGSMLERLEENKFLITQSPVLNLLHAHGDSPKELCSSRLVPFANRTRFTPSVRKFANHLITLKNVCLGFHPSNILTILTPLTFAPCNRAETLAMTAFSGEGRQTLSPARLSGTLIQNVYVSQRLNNVTDLADLRTDVAKRIQIANRLSRLSRKAFRRNSVSVEQIQDASQRLIVLTSLKVCRIYQSANHTTSQKLVQKSIVLLKPT